MAFAPLSLKARALRLLALREHSRAELQSKLARHVQEGDDLPALLDQLQAKGFIDETRVAESPTDAVDGADLVITTITVPLEPKLDCSNTDPNALLLPVDYDDALSPEAFNDAVVYCVDDLGQYESVADILYFFGLPKPATHLAAVVSGEYPVPTTGRRAFLNMGIAMDDVALSALVLDRALASGAGRYIEFP